MNNKRLTYIDFAKGIGILLVVLGHLEYISEDVRGFISAFHMPLFFVISGILMALKDEPDVDFGVTIKKKARSLLIPYMWFSLIYIPIDIMNVCVHHIDMNTFIFNIISSIIFSGVGVLWFLPALFIADIGALLFIKKLKKAYFVIPMSIVISITLYLITDSFLPLVDPMMENSLIYIIGGLIRVVTRGLIASIFVLAGFYSYKWLLGRKDSFSMAQLLAGITLIAITILLFGINGCVDYHYLILKNIAIYFPLAIIGSLGTILISKNIWSIRLIEFFGKNSLIIMATHVQCYILYIAIRLSGPVLMLGKGAFFSVLYVASILIITFIIEALIILVINRFFPFLIGKKK